MAKRTRNSVAAHSTNGSRKFLADTITAQQAEITKLGKEVANATLISSQVLEGNNRASVERERMREEIAALRSEQMQVTFQITSTNEKLEATNEKLATGVADLKATIADLKTTVKDHETERQQIKGAATLAKGMSGAGWGVVGFIGAGIMFAIGWLAKHIPTLFGGSPPPGGHP